MKKAIEEKRQRGLKEFRSLVENEQVQRLFEIVRFHFVRFDLGSTGS